MNKKKNKFLSKADIYKIIINSIVSLVSGLIVALFSFWLMKTYGYTVFGG